jgi:uncharacterized protein YjbJ (UPF0337 family)
MSRVVAERTVIVRDVNRGVTPVDRARRREVQNMTDDKIQGKWDQAKGEVKEGVGKMTGDTSTEMAGKYDQAKGKVEEGVGNVKQDIQDTVDSHR